ncbi:MAG: T9SS type A sorting domain-containing protein [Bacteroidales bacterium]|nr:T9SS type A sorting domain-containing protein [Bacteroidales bacterium]
MRKKLLFIGFALSVIFNSEASPTVADHSSLIFKDKVFNDYLSSWIANEGGTQRRHVPHTMSAMFVQQNGLVATICGWDEGGTNVAVYNKGEIISVPEGSGTGGWGRMSGCAVVLDEEYTYQLLTQHGCDSPNPNPNGNGLPQYPICDDEVLWHTIRRYDIQTGKSAPFSSGYGYKGDMLLVAEESAREMVGLAITSKELYVAVAGKESGMPDSIKVYSKLTMSSKPVRAFEIAGGVGYLSADAKRGLWMRQNNKIVRLSQIDGTPMGQEIVIPEGVVTQSFNVDLEGERLLLANSGRDLNVLIYGNIYSVPELSGTFGVKGGYLSTEGGYKKGAAGPLRFCGPQGAGVDGSGNIYVCNTFVGGNGAVLEAYTPEKELLWKTEGLVFTAVADFDRSDAETAYIPDKLFKIDMRKAGHRVDELIAYTVDPFTYPDDERTPGHSFITSTFKRTINGQSFLFVSDMYGGILEGYRYTEEDGYIGIPFLQVSNGGSSGVIRMWIDDNANGQKEDDEWREIAETNGYSMSFFPDKQGNIWRGSREQGFTLWKVGGNNSLGIPQYAEGVHYALPKGTNGVKRIYYLPERDELFLAGFSQEKPDSGDTWWALGSTVAKYTKAMERIEKGEDVSTWEPDLLLYIPFEANDETGIDAKAMAVEDNLIFFSMARNGAITVYNTESGEFLGTLSPGDELGRQSGWSDFNYCINAKKNEDGSYFVFNEENGFAKVVLYDLYGFSTEKRLQGDLKPTEFSFVDAEGGSYSIDALPVDKPIYPVIGVLNRWKGDVTQYNRLLEARCIAEFRLVDRETGEELYRSYSEAYKQDIAPSEEIDRKAQEPFTLSSGGNYILVADVNYGPTGKDMNMNNNVLEVELGASTAIEQTDSSLSLQLYPNPTSGHLVIQGASVRPNSQIKISSLDGTLLLSQVIATEGCVSLDVSFLPQGIYLLQIFADSRFVQWQKLIIQ